MKQTYFLCLLFVSLFSNSQIINFPDANFKAKLLAADELNAIAFINNVSVKIDTNNNGEIEINEASVITRLNVYSSNIANLDGINNFTNLVYLDCSSNLLTTLNFSQNVLLTNLSCELNFLANINVTQNTLLFYFNCSGNQLTNINISQNVLLGELYCAGNQLTNLDVSNNNNIYYVVCNRNLITSLDLSNNNLLASLVVNNNPIQYIILKNNHIDNLIHFLPNSCPNLQYICVDEIELNDIQNQVTQLGYTNCQVNSYCSFTPGGQFYTIQGQNKFDNENNGCDIADGSIPYLKFSISSGTTTGSIISNNTGNYSIPVQTGSHTITPILENSSYFNVSPTNIVVNFPAQASPFTQNFCITPNGEIHDVEISILPVGVAIPGFDCNYQIIYKNKGNQTENGTINLAFDDTIFDFVSTNVTTSSQTFGNLNWNYSNLQPFETRSIYVVLNLNSPMETPAVNANDILNFIATITIPGEVPCDNNSQVFSQCDNVFTLNQTVVNSYDPNDKTCLQGNTIAPEKVGDFVHYMIRFENTGTFPAENIVVKDMIDTAKFDVSSLIPLYASHNYITKIADNKVEFIFENINLPFDDANNDGYIAFKIKTLPTLVVGNTFSNLANIYFDYNFPIITNTAITTIAALSNPNFEFANYFSLFPNPTKNELNIKLKSAIEINSIQIYNAIGQLVTVQTGNALKLDVSNLKTGNYFIKVNTNEGFTTSQFIKE